MNIENKTATPVIDLGSFQDNRLWIKRDDLIPYSFGGNKVRKAILFFEEIDRGNYDCVVTYGAGSSNHCRVISNECCRRKMPCCIISPSPSGNDSFNSRIVNHFGSKVIYSPVEKVHDTIEETLRQLEREGFHPFFIEGGGHGNTGTEAYVRCYYEIKQFEESSFTVFDYIFFASGTGTTQAGLVCGQLLSHDTKKIVGISIARKNPRGRDVVLESIRSYLGDRVGEKEIQDATEFVDNYSSGYGIYDNNVSDTIFEVFSEYGISLDPIYTGKAFWGMKEYLKEKSVKDKNILFIHTGGTPLFFDFLNAKEF
ncbi:MAG: pyridoxal-phosphate dependent enzyme [Clostridia bacterium]|nr:pyridoxal-phosphate dependent enzyme [Clostridia bacterium]